MNEWHSVKKDGYPPDDTFCLVTVVYGDGSRAVEDAYTHVADVSGMVDKRTNVGKQFIADHPDGVWQHWHSDGFFESVYDRVIAWMPYSEMYQGE